MKTHAIKSAKYLLSAIVLSSALLFGNINVAKAQSAQTDAIAGTWISSDQSRTIEFVKNGNGYDAVIRKANDQSLLGQKQITGLRFDGKHYKNGTLHIIKQNKTLTCSATLKDANTLEITAKIGFVSKFQTWTRVR